MTNLNSKSNKRTCIVLLANSAWYLYNFRFSLAKAIAASGSRVILACPPGDFVEELRQSGFEVVTISLDRRSLNPLAALWSVIEIARLVRSFKVDLLHCFTIKCSIFGAIASIFRPEMRVVAAVTGLGYYFTSGGSRSTMIRGLLTCLMRLTFRRDGFSLIVQNEVDRDFFLRRNITARYSNVLVIAGSGVNCERFFPRREPAIDSDFTVLFAARLLREKGVLDFVEAARILSERNIKVQLMIAGQPDEGNPGSLSADQARLWEDEGLIKWLGHVGNMAELFRRVNLFVLPSYYGEGVPRSLIEAAACGLPLITTDTPGCRDVVRHGTEGLLVPIKDPDALADAIHFFYKNKDQCERMGASARERAVGVFEESLVISATFSVYSNLLGYKLGDNSDIFKPI